MLFFLCGMNEKIHYRKRGLIIPLFSRGKDKPSVPEIFQNSSLKKAIAFIDYESWYVSMNVNYGMKPNIKSWFETISKRYNLTETVFFADFSHKSLADEIQRIRPFSNKIIDTRNPTGVKKDFTDFIILDNIYQKAMMSEGIDVFILFSGDGHFSSVVSFLKNICGKEVGIFAVEGSFSRQLRECASWSEAVPDEDELFGNDYGLIFSELKNSKAMLNSTSLIENITKSNPRSKKKNLETILERLKKDGTVTERTVGKTKNALFVDWDKAKSSGYLKETE